MPMCVECEDLPAVLECLNCEDLYCQLCYTFQHKKGRRTSHKTRSLEPLQAEQKEALNSAQPPRRAPSKCSRSTENQKCVDQGSLLDSGVRIRQEVDYAKRAARTPLRLIDVERQLLRVLEGALDISEYTDKVDTSHDYFGWRVGNKTGVMKQELEEMFSLLCGLLVAQNFRRASTLVEDKDYKDNAGLFQKVFEVGRRFKIMNPEKMRCAYGKLMFLLQDCQQEDLVDFGCVCDIKTVHTLLEDKDSLVLLNDPKLQLAAMDVESQAKDRMEIEESVRLKKEARQQLVTIYSGSDHDAKLTSKEVELIIDSLADSNSFLTANVTPVEKMISYLQELFPPDSTDEKWSLAIRHGYGGSKLTHDHRTQHKFVLQSLLLWREIQLEMPQLWLCADKDLLSTNNPYRLYNTGQGLQRVQAAPRVSRAMHSIVHKVQQLLGSWVGLSVVHLGDRDVPNALTFIDKYTQVPRILGPIVRTVESLDRLCEDDHLRHVVDSMYGGTATLRKLILRDFFRHGFDGSGDDGGSCVDGRLTSAWNWCSKLEKKQFYHIFMLAGFEGFDGSFKK